MLALIRRVMATASVRAQPGTIRIIFPYAAGGSGDATARLLADKLQTSLGQTVLVENRTGGAGRIGVNAVKNAAADGSTLLFTPFAAVTIYPFAYRSLDYDPFTDLAPIPRYARLISRSRSGQTFRRKRRRSWWPG